MSIPRKGSRKIIVDGEEYIWLVRGRPTYTQDCQEGKMSAAVELGTNPGTTLLVTFPFTRPDSAFLSESSLVTPKMIEGCIKEALENGWQPNKSGGTYKQEYPAHT